jgi:hypothetical protein
MELLKQDENLAAPAAKIRELIIGSDLQKRIRSSCGNASLRAKLDHSSLCEEVVKIRLMMGS